MWSASSVTIACYAHCIGLCDLEEALHAAGLSRSRQMQREREICRVWIHGGYLGSARQMFRNDVTEASLM